MAADDAGTPDDLADKLADEIESLASEIASSHQSPEDGKSINPQDLAAAADELMASVDANRGGATFSGEQSQEAADYGAAADDFGAGAASAWSDGDDSQDQYDDSGLVGDDGPTNGSVSDYGLPGGQSAGFAPSDFGGGYGSSMAPPRGNPLGRLAHLPIQVAVRIAERKIPLSQLLALTPGTLLTFTRSCEELLDLYVGNQLYGRGEAVKIGEHFGIKINEIGSTPEPPKRVLHD